MSEFQKTNSFLNQTSSGSEQASSNESDNSNLFKTTSKPVTSEVIEAVKVKQPVQSDADPECFKCSHCSKVSLSKSAYKRHEKTHGEKKFKCSYCTNTYLYRASKVIHERTHTGEKPFSCSFCSKAFTFQTSQIRHERSHTRAFPFKCSFCTAAFHTQPLLNIHIRTHLKANAKEVKPRKGANTQSVKPISVKIFKCSFCPKLWRNAYDRKRHEHTHTQPFKCAYCSKQFSRGHSKIKHEKTHLKLGNVESPSSLPKPGNTVNHETKKVHTNKMRMRSHQCTYCSKSFFSSSARIRHERNHSGETPFSCRYCPKTFSSQGNMRKHERIHLKYSNVEDLEADTLRQSDLPSSVAPSSLKVEVEDRNIGVKDEKMDDVGNMKDPKAKKSRTVKKSKISGIFSKLTETKMCSLCLRLYEGISIKDDKTYSPSLCPACSSAFFESAPPCH